jgi:hypothetical protein
MIKYPYELFNTLPVSEADKLQVQMIDIYFADKPEILQDIVDRAEGNIDLINLYKEEEFNKALQEEYAYDIEILSNRIDDPLAEALVDAINTYNIKLERQQI